MSAELIEIFSEDCKILGTRPRGEVHSIGFWHRGVHCFLFDSSGKLLVQRRSDRCDTYPNSYDCSVSEHLGVGESFEEAVIRGCKEELGVAPYDLKKLISYKMQYGPTDKMICDLYSAQISQSDVHINESEVAAIEYLEVTEILESLKSQPTQFTSWFRQQLYWFDKKPHQLTII